ncbi:MAG: ATP-dependent Clp protease proteolytic subunit [Candidatus Dojkabacteria bacterium]|nr:ATP-dependent Clp protease proteolytic subunit [Candidatus Dojkabacteria bacterium]
MIIKNNDYYDFEFSCNKKGKFFLFGEINEEITKNCLSWLYYSKINEKTIKNLEIIIKSEGGDPMNAFTICDTIDLLNMEIRTTGVGTVCSSALLIFIAGKKGERKISKNCQILSHQYSWGMEGKSHELNSIKKELLLMDERFVNHYKKHTNLDEKTIRKKLLCPSDVWLRPEEAKKLNLVDIIF